MRYETIKHLKDTDFKRLTGVQRETFEMMLKEVEKGQRDFGRPSKLKRADQLLMTLMYWREYRTEFHIAQSYDISETTTLNSYLSFHWKWQCLICHIVRVHHLAPYRHVLFFSSHVASSVNVVGLTWSNHDKIFFFSVSAIQSAPEL